MSFTYDQKQLIELMNDFYALTKIKTVLYDSNFKTITAVPYEECAFCTALRQTPEMLNRCNNCTTQGIELSRRKSKINIYKCHAGLIEAVSPIKLNGVILGYMMLGQVLEEEDREMFLKNVSEYTDEHVRHCAERLVTKNQTEIRAAAKIMEGCVCYLLMNKVIKEDSGNTALMISRYIDQNITGDLSVESLCEVFEISRNKLYKIADVYFGMPVAKYVLARRIERAEQLIREGVSVTRAAALAGFCDYGYFGKVFKAHTGKTPTKA